MRVYIDKTFAKDTSKIEDKKLLNQIAEIIEDIQSAEKLSALTNCKKLKGSKNAFRIKIGEYRIGLIFEDESVELIRFIHRSKIFTFPPK